MKKPLLITVLLSLSLQLIASDGSLTAKGIIISIDKASVEIKSGGKENLLYFGGGMIVTRGAVKADVTELKMCQLVIVKYIRLDGKKVIKSLNILRKSYCE
jgi:hypothetical protein